jgi:molybdenum cofactor cytidylyltransferase
MDLRRALRISPGWKIAFTGSGGKTSAMFTLARQLPPPVLLTATTHLGHDQLVRADRAFTVRSPADLPADDIFNQPEVLLFVGPEANGWRTSGISPETYLALAEKASQTGATLLIEADGSRQLPLKAPAVHEPAIPPGVDAVVVSAGLQGYGRPLDENWVHRPELFADIAELMPGEEINQKALARVLAHPQGGLKGIAGGITRCLLLNQADTPELQAMGAALAYTLRTSFDRIVVAALAPGAMPGSRTGSDVAPPEASPGVYASICRTAAVILAAGGSVRYGQPKQLLEWRGMPFLRAVALSALNAGLETIVVTGSRADEVSKTVADLPITIINNPDWQSGQSTSIAVGLGGLDKGVGAVVFLQADKPQVDSSLLRALQQTYFSNGDAILAPMVAGERTSPVLLDRETFKDLLALKGDVGGRAIFSKYRVSYLPWNDEALLIDVDRPQNYQNLLEFE